MRKPGNIIASFHISVVQCISYQVQLYHLNRDVILLDTYF